MQILQHFCPPNSTYLTSLSYNSAKMPESVWLYLPALQSRHFLWSESHVNRAHHACFPSLRDQNHVPAILYIKQICHIFFSFLDVSWYEGQSTTNPSAAAAFSSVSESFYMRHSFHPKFLPQSVISIFHAASVFSNSNFL